MELTLEQLSPENMKMLLESAFITVDSIIPVEFEEDGTESYITPAREK